MTARADRSDSMTAVRRFVRGYVARMRGLGLKPNRSVAFEGHEIPAWLIDDPHHHALCVRWLALEDGDVWSDMFVDEVCDEVAYESAQTWAGWVTRPGDAPFVALLASLADAREGGRGYLLAPTPSRIRYGVTDRRRRPRADTPPRVAG